MTGANLVLGCDPGLGGYIAVLNANTFEVQFHSLPVSHYSQFYTSQSGERKERHCKRIDEDALLRLIRDLSSPHVARVMLEFQQPYPRQGVVSTGKTLYVFGLLKGLLLSTPMPLKTVRPAAWKKALGLTLKHDQGLENESRYKKKCRAWQKCLDLFPELRPVLTPKSYSFDKCEALLLAYFGLTYDEKWHADEDDQPALL